MAGEKEKVKLTIYGKLNNLNDYINACRGERGWITGAKMKQDNDDRVKSCILEQLGYMKFEGQVRLDFKWIEPNRRRDLDNICSAKKFILDALQGMGTIEGDGWKHIEGFTDSFEVDKDHPRIEVIIEGRKKK